jgi:hypothetical protein
MSRVLALYSVTCTVFLPNKQPHLKNKRYSLLFIKKSEKS